MFSEKSEVVLSVFLFRLPYESLFWFRKTLIIGKKCGVLFLPKRFLSFLELCLTETLIFFPFINQLNYGIIYIRSNMLLSPWDFEN